MRHGPIKVAIDGLGIALIDMGHQRSIRRTPFCSVYQLNTLALEAYPVQRPQRGTDPGSRLKIYTLETIRDVRVSGFRH